MSATAVSDIAHKQNVGQVSNNMRALTSRDRDLLSRFDKIDESEAETESTSLLHHLNNNHDLPANKGKIIGQLPLEHSFGFCQTF